MSADTSLDPTVLDDLDFEPACELDWSLHGDGENATHIGRSVCPGCGHRAARLLGPRCVAFVSKWPMVCARCDTDISIKLEPLQ